MIKSLIWLLLVAPVFQEPPAPRPVVCETVEEAAVTMSCLVGEDRRASECEIVSEDPPGCDFGAHAIEAMREARFARRPRNGSPEENRARFTIRFRADDAPRRRSPPAPNHSVPFPDPSGS